MRFRRKAEEGLLQFLMVFSLALVVLSLLGILLTVCINGIPSLSWEMLSQTTKGGFFLGKGGGILNAVIGSLYISLGAVAISFLFSLLIAVFLRMQTGRLRRFCACIRFILDILTGIPSIVYGAFGFTLMLVLGIRASLLGGIITVSLLILPIMVRGMDEVLSNVPQAMLEAASSLGATKLEVSTGVLLRQGIPGIITAVLIAFGRAIGDAASVIFTAGFSDNIPTSLSEPAATLPLAIFFQLGTPIAEVRMKAYSSAFVLTAIILITSAVSRLIGGRMSKKVIR